MTVVAVTGASGYLGRRVLSALEGLDGVRRVIGIDVVEPGISTRNLEFYRLDVRSSAVRDVIAGADVLVHLAFILRPQRDEEEMADVNVGGTRNVLAAAVGAGVRKVVYASSVTAYGAHPDNDFPLTEESSIRPIRDFSYSAHKGECEEILQDFRETHPGVVVTVLRPAVVLGPQVEGFVAGLVESPFSLTVVGYEPPVQVVHEDDVTHAIVFALENDLDGSYNLCADGWVPQDRAIRLLGQRRIPLGYEDAQRRMDRLWRIGASDFPPSFVPFLMYPWVMSNVKIKDAGFTFRHGNEDTLRDAAQARKGWVTLGRLRFRPRNVVVTVAGAAVLLGSLVRRARRGSRVD